MLDEPVDVGFEALARVDFGFDQVHLLVPDQQVPDLAAAHRPDLGQEQFDVFSFDEGQLLDFGVVHVLDTIHQYVLEFGGLLGLEEILQPVQQLVLDISQSFEVVFPPRLQPLVQLLDGVVDILVGRVFFAHDDHLVADGTQVQEAAGGNEVHELNYLSFLEVQQPILLNFLDDLFEDELSLQTLVQFEADPLKLFLLLAQFDLLYQLFNLATRDFLQSAHPLQLRWLRVVWSGVLGVETDERDVLDQGFLNLFRVFGSLEDGMCQELLPADPPLLVHNQNLLQEIM